VTNVSNFTSKNNPPWLLAEPAGPVRPPGPNVPDQAAHQAIATASRADSGSRRARFERTLLIVGRVLLSWLAAIPRRLGDRLFAMNDAEAFWRDWQITRTRGGLGRRYRDPRFSTLAECSKCRGTGRNGAGRNGAGRNGAGANGAANLPCVPCLGTGRMTLGEVS
jgi:hypothetical protein